MFPSVLQYQFITPLSCSQSYCGCVERNPVFNWLMYGKLPVTQVVTPNYQEQVFTPALKRYFASVKVKRVPVVVGTVSLAVAGVATYTFDGAKSVVSSVPATATATITNGVVTITGVAAGTTAVTIYDANDNVIANVSVTVA